MLANILVVILVIVLFIAAFVLVRTITFGKALELADPVELPEVDGAVIAEHLAAVLRHATISNMDPAQTDYQPFADLRRELERMYPRTHAALRLDLVNRHSLLYTWQGRDPSLAPVLLTSHQDVVPVDPASRDEWKYAPFEGRVADGYVWGRGSLDTKNTLIASLEAVEYLLKTGYQPERTIYLGYGHDEEVGGHQGAAQIAGRLQANGMQLEALLDEGGAILPGAVPGVAGPVAAVGVSEKGYLSMELRVEGRGGHSSMPPPHTAIGVLSRALTRLEAAPMPLRMGTLMVMFRSLAPYLPLGLRASFANQWLFGAGLRKRLTSVARTNAMVRTTTAITMIHGGIKDNLLPAQVSAVVNFRLMPGDRVADVVEFARKAAADDAVQIHLPEGGQWEASPVSPIDSPAAKILVKTIGQVYPEAVTAPYLVSGATDSRYYVDICPNVYRFSPMLISGEDLGTIHANNERIAISSLERMVQFYILLTKAWTGKKEGG